MESGALRILRSAPHVIVLGNGKGGTGKTTLAMHVAVGLLNAGWKVATLDLDTDQQCLSHYLDNRRLWAKHAKIDLAFPVHRHIASAEGSRAEENETQDLVSLEHAVAGVASCDFLVVDTPSHDTYLGRVAHLVADAILTPIQDSFLDLCALGSFDPVSHRIVRTGHYAGRVCAARKVRRQFESSFSDWLVICARASGPQLVKERLGEIGQQVGFRHIDGLAERPVYRRLFPLGLTVFDPLPDPLRETCNISHPAARNENEALMGNLQLSVSARRLVARSEWLRQRSFPLQLDEIVMQE